MASRTRRELIDQVLENLGILVPGQAPSDDSVTKVDRPLDAILASLAARDIVFVADIGTSAPPFGGEFDEAVFMPIADLVADRLAAAFNMAGDPQLKASALLAEDELRVIARPLRTRKALVCDAGVRTQHTRGVGNFTSGT